MRRALAAALAVGVCSATLAGCTEDSPAGPTTVTSPGTTSRTPSTATTEPTKPTASTTTTEPASPVMPALAKKQSKAGAKAFVRHYVDVLNYAWTQLKPRTLVEVSSDDCRVCSLIIRRIAITDQKGGYQVGGEWSPRRIYALPGQSARQPKFLVTIDIRSGTWKPARGQDERKISSSRVTNEFDLTWMPQGWATLDLRAT